MKDSTKDNEEKIIRILNSLNIPFSGITIEFENKKYHISPFQQSSVSGIGSVFYLNKKDQKIYTLLQRRFQDNFWWWFPGGYAELPSNNNFFKKNFKKIKDATIGEYQKKSIKQGWQKALKELNDPKKIAEIFKKHKINWPKEFDFNWQSTWQRELLEETGINLDKFKNKLVFDLKNNQTFMIGVEPDRLINIDGKFCALLGELETPPKLTASNEIEEVKWIALDEIYFDKKNYLADGKIINIYAVTLIEEGLFKIICHKIKEISKITNPITKQEISRFDSPQNLQSFLILNPQIKYNEEIDEFLKWEFGDLEIGKNLCGKNGNRLYEISLSIAGTI